MSKKSAEGTKDWAVTNIPQFTGQKAFILNAAWYGEIVNFLARAGFSRAVTIEEADVVVFGGGHDIDPKLYGQKRLSVSHWSVERDTIEQFTYNKALKLGKPMFGICRGLQFLWAMNGGQLYQDVNNHGGTRHMIVDLDDDVRVLANSYHHQMVQMTKDIEERARIIAVCEDQVATRFEDANIVIDLRRKGANANYELEIEAASFIDTGCFGVQGHPEVGNDEYKAWSLFKLQDFLHEFKLSKEELKQEIIPTLH